MESVILAKNMFMDPLRKSTKDRRFRHRAFTLIEMLIVITIIAILIAITAPAIFGTLKATRMTGAGQQLQGALSEAQQTAFAQNCAIEFRFYQYAGKLGDPAAIRGFQLFKITSPPGLNTETITKMGETIKLPDGVIVSSDAVLSPCVTAAFYPDAQGNSGVAGADYSAIRFLPDGTCKKVSSNGGLASLQFQTLAQSFMTIVEETGAAATPGEPTDNFYCIQIDPFTGRARAYRPGF
ncbi:hypothetical protein BH11VER1_BH11VER1_17220 [soil metagenome]